MQIVAAAGYNTGLREAMSEFLKKLSKSLGISYTWWQWRWLNFKKRWRAAFSTDKNAVRHLRTRQKICSRCGALAGAEDGVCGVCGARLPSAAASFAGKIFGLILPGVSPVTAVLVAVIGLNFAVQVISTRGAALLTPNLGSLLRAGAMESSLVASGEWWRLLTCVFVHIGIIHFLFNTVALLSVSSFLEGEIGPARYLTLFLLAGIGGSGASYLLHGRVLAAGASGAIFGLIGFSISYFQRQGGSRAAQIRSFMLKWALYGLVFGFLVRADNIAHAGGFATGFLLGSIMEFREDERRSRNPAWSFAAGLLALGFVVSFVLLARSR
jgi:rhomboid protease GluP